MFTKSIRLATAAGAVLVAGTLSASAALLDFTDETNGVYDVQGTSSASGTLADGNTWEITPIPSTYDLTYVSDDAPNGATPPLQGDNDGIGVVKSGGNNDEITAPREMVKLTFKNAVRLTGLYFLDLFTNGDDPNAPDFEREVALVSVDGAPNVEFGATETFVQGGFGFGSFMTDLVGKTFIFAAANTNDDVARPDYALAGVDVSPIPLPAGMLLLGTALAGLGITRRRKS